MSAVKIPEYVRAALDLPGDCDRIDEATRRRAAVLVEARDVVTRPPCPLIGGDPVVRDRFIRGKVTLLEGAPGVSKTTLALDVAARATRAGIDVVVMSAEDDVSDTLVPRLKLAGADLARVHFLAGKVGQAGALDDDLAFPVDVDVLRDAVRRTGAGLALVDPLFAYVATSTDANGDHKIRRALGPLHRLAAEMDLCVIAIRRRRKAAGADPVNAGGGSIGIIAAARLALLVAKDPDTEGAVLLASVKTNIGPTPPTLRYRLVTGELPEHPGVTWTKITWEGVSERTAEDVLGAQLEVAGLPVGRALSSGCANCWAKAPRLPAKSGPRPRPPASPGPRSAGPSTPSGSGPPGPGGLGASGSWAWELPSTRAKVLTDPLRCSPSGVGTLGTLGAPERTPEDLAATEAAVNAAPEPTQGTLQNPPTMADTCVWGGIAYKVGDTLPDGRRVLDPVGPIFSKRPPGPPQEAAR